MIKILPIIGCALMSWDGLVIPPWSFSYGPPKPDDQLQALVDRSDLIIVATPQNVCSFCLGSGPCAKPGEDKWVPSYEQFLPRLKINQVVKGNVAASKILLISYTAINWVNGKDMFILDPKAPLGSPQNPVFNVGQIKKDEEVGLPGSPLKGTQYIFFLENSKMREPKSYQAAGKEEIIYRNFDFQMGMIPASAAAITKLKELAKGA